MGLGFLPQHSLRKQPPLTSTGLDSCFPLKFHYQLTGMSSLTLEDSDHTPEKNINLPKGHQDLVPFIPQRVSILYYM